MNPEGPRPGDDVATELLETSRSASRAANGERFLPGQVVAGRYRIAGLLGRGGMGEVYRADDLKLGQTVALKFLPAAAEGDSAWLERLFAEVRIARQVAHPNVCRVFDVGEADGQHFLAMEHVEGEDLGSLLRRIGQLPQAKATQIARELCAGLAAAHGQGILHRDLKPANVMLDERGQVRLTDFGLAALAAEIGGAEARSGTPAYMAPEQLAGREVSVQSDLYALGLLLYELLTGERPFRATTLAESRGERESSVPARPSTHVDGLDPALEAVILRCLEPDPSQRPTSALAVAAALPGGDPLAAALAAGETPSPEMVAAAPTEGTLRALPAVALLAGAIILASGTLVLDQRQTASLGETPPAALADRAERNLRSLGYEDDAVDSAFGFFYDPATVTALEALPRDEAKALLARQPELPVRFWYRESPERLLPIAGDVVSLDDPPATLPGMRSVVIDTEGRLVHFTAVPDPTLGGSPEPPSAKPVFDAAGLDPARFRAVEPVRRPDVHADRLAAWESTEPAHPTGRQRVEVAWAGERPVWIVVRGAADGAFPGETASLRAPPAFALLFLTLQIGVLVVGLVFARRSLAAGRGDLRGAKRLAIFYFVAASCFWLFRADHSPTLAELGHFWGALARAWLGASVVWALYVGLEPFARRRWPATMISWTRLLTGRARDPLVGRDLLLGTAAGWLCLFFFRLGTLSETMFGTRWTLQLTSNPDLAIGVSGPLAHLSRNLFQGTVMGLGALLLMVAFAYLLRSDRLAVVAFWLVQMAWFVTFSQTVEGALTGLAIGTVITLGLRFIGLLWLCAAYLAVHTIVIGAVNGHLDSWTAAPTLALTGVSLAVGLFGFLTCLGRPDARSPSAAA